jgi:hypothetical protein
MNSSEFDSLVNWSGNGPLEMTDTEATSFYNLDQLVFLQVDQEWDQVRCSGTSTSYLDQATLYGHSTSSNVLHEQSFSNLQSFITADVTGQPSVQQPAENLSLGDDYPAMFSNIGAYHCDLNLT